ncbi:MAG: Ig-like domain-containing protein [Gemmatimonadaceae bacterium]|nr:Ig-like domain-containing protein [Gemmatimonadaceae bacterium]
MLSSPRFSALRTFGVSSIVVTSVLLAACNSTTESAPDSRIPTTIVVNAGVDGQTANVGAALPTLASVTVRDQDGQLLPGAVVLWAVRSGGGTVGLTSTTTDTLGKATTSWVMGRTAGTQILLAAISAVDTIRITATARALSPTTFELIDGDNQELLAGTISAPFQVRAQDMYLNPVPNEPVRWQASAGTLTSDTTLTNSAGIASVQLTAPATVSTVAITARLANGSSLSFQARVRPQ